MTTFRKPAKANAANIYYLEDENGNRTNVGIEWLHVKNGDITALSPVLQAKTAAHQEIMSDIMRTSTDGESGWETTAGAERLVWLPLETPIHYEIHVF